MRFCGLLLKFIGLCSIGGLLLAGFLFPAAGAFGLVVGQSNDAFNAISTDLRTVDPPMPSKMLDRNGNPIAWFYVQDRDAVTFDQLIWVN